MCSRQATFKTPAFTEEDLYAEKVQQDFPSYAVFKTDDITWKRFYENRVEKREKEQAKKLNMVIAKIGKTTKPTRKIEVVHISGRWGSLMIKTPSALELSKARKAVATGSTRIHRITPPTAAIASKIAAKAKKQKQLMSKSIKMKKEMRRG